MAKTNSKAKYDQKRRRQQARQRGKEQRAKLAELPRTLIADSDEPVELLAAGEGEEADSSPRKFRMVAYNGGKMKPKGFGLPVVAELSGMRALGGKRPIHFAHDQTRPVGHADTIDIQRSVTIDGALSVDNDDSRMIAQSSDDGFPWRGSVGLAYEKILFFDVDEKFKANNRTFKGPCFYIPKSQLFEASFVTVAGDNTSSAKVAATYGVTNTGENDMDFIQWLEANGWDEPAKLSEQQQKFLQAMFDQEQSDGDGSPGGEGTSQGGSSSATLTASAEDQADQVLLATRQKLAAEVGRTSEIQILCAQYDNPTIEIDGQTKSLEAHAIAEGWTRDQVELRALKASRATAPAIHQGTKSLSEPVLEAAVRLSLNQDDKRLTAEYGEEVVDQADRYRNLGLRELAAMSCQVEGVSIPAVWGDGRKTLQAAFTTQTLPNVMENVMNKTLLPIWDAVEKVAMNLCSISRTTDFKQVSKVRLLGSGAWEKVGPDGELNHGRVSDEKFTNQADTFGQFLMISRQDWRNDDLGALDTLATYMALMGAQVVEDEFFTVLLANANNFFHANNANLGAGVAFGGSGLTALKTLFRKQKKGPGSRSKNSRPINVRPVNLLVPVEVEDDGFSLLGSDNKLIENQDTTATAATTVGQKNPHKGRYTLYSAPQLSDPAFTGYSATAYYLFADPRIVAAFDLLFLDGISRPTIERVESPPNQLGMGFRGYLDFGVAQQEPKGAAKDAGA